MCPQCFNADLTPQLQSFHFKAFTYNDKVKWSHLPSCKTLKLSFFCFLVCIFCPMIYFQQKKKKKKSYYCHFSRDQFDKIFTGSARDESTWPFLLHHIQRWGYLDRERRFIPWVNRVLGWNHVNDTNERRLKAKCKKEKKKRGKRDDFLISIILWFPGLVLPIALQMFGTGTL